MLEVLWDINSLKTKFIINYSTPKILKLIKAFKTKIFLMMKTIKKEQRITKHPGICNNLLVLFTPSKVLLKRKPFASAKSI